MKKNNNKNTLTLSTSNSGRKSCAAHHPGASWTAISDRAGTITQDVASIADHALVWRPASTTVFNLAFGRRSVALAVAERVPLIAAEAIIGSVTRFTIGNKACTL
jgi:hypothetical protein